MTARRGGWVAAASAGSVVLAVVAVTVLLAARLERDAHNAIAAAATTPDAIYLDRRDWICARYSVLSLYPYVPACVEYRRLR